MFPQFSPNIDQSNYSSTVLIYSSIIEENSHYSLPTTLGIKTVLFWECKRGIRQHSWTKIQEQSTPLLTSTPRKNLAVKIRTSWRVESIVKSLEIFKNWLYYITFLFPFLNVLNLPFSMFFMPYHLYFLSSAFPKSCILNSVYLFFRKFPTPFFLKSFFSVKSILWNSLTEQVPVCLCKYSMQRAIKVYYTQLWNRDI